MNRQQPMRRLNLEAAEQVERGHADDFRGRVIRKYTRVRKEDFDDAAHQVGDTVLQIEYLFGRPATVRTRTHAQMGD